MDAWRYVDGTGVGAGVREMLTLAHLAGRMGNTWPQAITITGAERASGRNVPKGDLFTALQLPLQQGRFKIAEGLPLGDVLERELTSSRMKLSAAGRDSYDIQRREGEGHGDLVIAVCLAARSKNPGVSMQVVQSEAWPVSRASEETR